MFMGRTHGLPEYSSPNDVVFPDHVLESDEEEEDSSSQILHTASFDELAGNYIQYETIIWLSISLLLVLAWGIGVIMLLYLPFKTYVLQKDVSSRKLYVTPTEFVYKVSRPSYVPCWKTVTRETRVPLSLVIDIIIEQGCLQSVFGIHTFRMESISRGKAARVDELQIQGVSNPGLLRKVIITEASKAIRDAGKMMTHMSSLNQRLGSSRPPSNKWKILDKQEKLLTEKKVVSTVEIWSVSLFAESFLIVYPLAEYSPIPISTECSRGMASGELFMHKLNEVDKSVKKIESLIMNPKSQQSQLKPEGFEDATSSL